MLIFRQLFDPPSSTYSYLLADPDTLDAVLIDPVFEQARRDATLVQELGLRLRWTLETHVHADHVTGGWQLRQRLGSGFALSAHSGASGADRYLQDGEQVVFGKRHLEVRATPGHTDGCLTFVIDDQTMAFTGDCLLVRGSGRTDFQQGSPEAMYRSVRERIFTLPSGCLLYPGHDYRGMTVTTVAEERRLNPRLGGAVSVHDFRGTMEHLALPHPKKIDVAVPANLRCGQPQGDEPDEGSPPWPGLNFTFAGVWEIQPYGLEEIGAEVQIVDVREPDEFNGMLAHIPRAVLIPLGQLQQRAGELDKARPLVAVCRSGARSAQAVTLLQKQGFTRVANLSGGMLRWHADGGALEGGIA